MNSRNRKNLFKVALTAISALLLSTLPALSSQAYYAPNFSVSTSGNTVTINVDCTTEALPVWISDTIELHPGDTVVLHSIGTAPCNTIYNPDSAVPTGEQAPYFSSLPATGSVSGDQYMVSRSDAPIGSQTGRIVYYNGSNYNGIKINFIFVTPPPPPATPKPYLTVLNMNDSDCNIRVLGSLPATPDAGSIRLVVNDVSSLIFLIGLRDFEAGELIDLTIPADDFTSIRESADVTFDDLGDTRPLKCGEALDFTLAYSSGGSPAAMAMSSVTPTRPTAPVQPLAPMVSVTPVSNSVCSMIVSVNIPQAPDAETDVNLVLSSVATSAGYEMRLTGYTPGQLFTINFPVGSMDQLASNYVDGTPSALPGSSLSCNDKIVAQVSGQFSSQTLSTSTEEETPSLLCPAGRYLNSDIAVCMPNAIGFYTSTSGATEPTACPTGMTTAATGSMSINDCYKPITQSITKFKAPKAMKIGAKVTIPVTTNTKAIATAQAIGSCKVVVKTFKVKQGKKKVSVKLAQVQASKKAGNCTVTFASPATGKYLALSKTVKIKVNKKGK